MVIFVPMLLEEPAVDSSAPDDLRVPPPPAEDAAFSSENILPLENEPLADPPPLPGLAEAPEETPEPTPATPVRPAAETEPVSPEEAEPTAMDEAPVAEESSPQPGREAATEAPPVAPVAVAPPASAAKPTPRVGISAWAVQVASFSSQQNAENLLQRLRADKFPAFIEFAAVGGRSLYRVRIGPEVDRKRAEQMAQEIRQQHALKANVVRYP